MSKKVVVLMSTLLFSSLSFAGEQIGNVIDIRVRASDGLHWFYVEGELSNKPNCASENGRWIIKDENSIAAKSQLSLLITAFASGAKVKVIGTGECTRWSSGEDVDSIQLVK